MILLGFIELLKDRMIFFRNFLKSLILLNFSKQLGIVL